MSSAQAILDRDLTIFKVMVANLPEYLTSDNIDLKIYGHNIPKLTIGGCLMRQQRLNIVKFHLSPEQQESFAADAAELAHLMANNVVRFEQKTHQELHVRLGEWMYCLRYITHHKAGEECFFDDKVDTRVVIAAMIKQMSQSPFQLEKQVTTQINTLDNNLRQRWQPGDFIWHAVWQEAYPPNEYWYLYGRPA